jgi:hypothetical protein
MVVAHDTELEELFFGKKRFQLKAENLLDGSQSTVENPDAFLGVFPVCTEKKAEDQRKKVKLVAIEDASGKTCSSKNLYQMNITGPWPVVYDTGAGWRVGLLRSLDKPEKVQKLDNDGKQNTIDVVDCGTCGLTFSPTVVSWGEEGLKEVRLAEASVTCGLAQIPWARRTVSVPSDRIRVVECIEVCEYECPSHALADSPETFLETEMNGVGMELIVVNDTLLRTEVSSALAQAVQTELDRQGEKKEYHPGSDNKVLDIVHPALYCYVAGESFHRDGKPREFVEPEREEVVDFSDLYQTHFMKGPLWQLDLSANSNKPKDAFGEELEESE